MHKLDGCCGSSVSILGRKMPRSADSELRAWASSQDRKNIHAIEIAKPIDKKIDTKSKHVAHIRVVLDVEPENLITSILPRLGPVAGMVEQGQHHLVSVRPSFCLRSRM